MEALCWEKQEVEGAKLIPIVGFIADPLRPEALAIEEMKEGTGAAMQYKLPTLYSVRQLIICPNSRGSACSVGWRDTSSISLLRNPFWGLHFLICEMHMISFLRYFYKN